MTGKNLVDRMNTLEANKKKGPGRYNWELIAQDYITSDMTLHDVVEKYGMQLRTASKRCSDGKWIEKRKQYRQNLEKETLKKTAKKTASKRSDILDSVLASTSRSADIVADRLNNDEELTSLQVKQYLESLKLIEDMARSIQGILTKQQERKLKLEEERLELEKRKIEAGEPDRDINITIRGYKDEWGE